MDKEQIFIRDCNNNYLPVNKFTRNINNYDTTVYY